jgi:surface antigen
MSASFRSAHLFSFGAVAGVIAMVGCSSTERADGETIGSTDEAITIPHSLCGRAALQVIDDIPAYANDCGNVNVWSNDGRTTATHAGSGSGWIETEGGYGYQCVELAVRYTHFKFETPDDWHVAAAYEMCDTPHPAGISKTTSPVHGDLIVVKPHECGLETGFGHVAIVDSISGAEVSVIEQNEGSTGKGTYNKSCALCFLHEARNNICGNAADGSYCGDTNLFKSGKKGTLYTCKSYELKSSKACANGCEGDSGKTDECAPTDAGGDAESASDDAGERTSNEDDASSSYGESDSGAATTSPTDNGNSGDSGGGCAITRRDKSSDRFAAIFAAIGVIAVARRRRSRNS